MTSFGSAVSKRDTAVVKARAVKEARKVMSALAALAAFAEAEISKSVESGKRARMLRQMRSPETYIEAASTMMRLKRCPVYNLA